MQRLICTFFAAAIVSSASAQISPAGLVAHWRFSGNTLDSSGNANHATNAGNAYAPGREGLPNTAVLFNSPTGYLYVPYSPSLNVGQFSVCAVVMPTVFNTGSCQGNILLERGRPGSTGSAGLYALGFSDNAYDENCNTFDTSLNCFFLGTSTNAPSYQSGQYQPTIRTNTWTSVVATFDGSTTRVYVDGVLKTVQSTPTPIGTSTEGLAIGTSPTEQSYLFTGLMDDLRLYNRVLTDSEAYYYHNPPSLGGVADAGLREAAIALFPNPASDQLTVQFSGIASGEVSLRILDQMGRSVLTRRMTGTELTLDVQHLPAGLYFVRLSMEDGVTVRPFVKQ